MLTIKMAKLLPINCYYGIYKNEAVLISISLYPVFSVYLLQSTLLESFAFITPLQVFINHLNNVAG